MPENHARKKAIRDLMAQANIPYSEAAQRIDDAKADGHFIGYTKTDVPPAVYLDWSETSSHEIVSGAPGFGKKSKRVLPFGPDLDFGVWDTSDEIRPSHLVVIGQPGSGKTVLCRALAYRAQERGWKVVALNLRSGDASDLAKTLQELCWTTRDPKPPTLVIVDNADQLDPCNITTAVDRLVRLARVHDIHLVVTTSPEDPCGFSETFPSLWERASRVVLGSLKPRSHMRSRWAWNVSGLDDVLGVHSAQIPVPHGCGVFEPNTGEEPFRIGVVPPGKAGDAQQARFVEGDPSRILPFGAGTSGETISWNTTKIPHLVIVGSTGSGKTTACRALAASASERDWDVEYLNPKVDRSQVHDRVEMVADLVDQRQEQVGDRNPMLVVIDEFEYLNDGPENLRRELGDAVELLAARGRSVGVHLVVTTMPVAPSRSIKRWGGRGPLWSQAGRLVLGDLDKVARSLWFRMPRRGPIPSGPGGGIYEPGTGPEFTVKVNGSAQMFDGEGSERQGCDEQNHGDS